MDVHYLNTGTVNKSESFSDDFAMPTSDLTKIQGMSPNTRRQITNDIKKQYTGQEGTRSKNIQPESEVTGYDIFKVVSPPLNLDYLARLYELSEPHYAAVKAKVANIVGLGYDLVETPRTKAKIDAATDSDQLAKMRRKLTNFKNQLLDTLDGFNAEDTFLEVLTKVWTDYEVTGNGYIEVGRISTGPRAGAIGYIGHVPATTLRVRRERDGFVQIISNKAVFFRNFGDKTTTDPIGKDANPNEIIHIKKYAPSSGYYGIPDVVPAVQSITGMEFAGRFNLDYFENKAVPRHVIILKGAKLGPKAERNLMEFFETGLKGKNHRSLYIPLPGDSAAEKVEFKIEPVEAGIQDSSFANYDKSNIDKILMAHRVPITKVSQSNGIALAAARDADKTFKEQVCQPEQKILEPKLNKIMKELTDMFQIKLTEMTLTDEDVQSQIDERMLKVGVLTRNEVRARKGLPGIDKGDEIIDMNNDAATSGGNTLLSEARAEGNRERDAERSAGQSDAIGEGRNEQGAGRRVE